MIASATREYRRPLFDERLHAFQLIGRAEEAVEDVALMGHAIGQPGFESAVHAGLGQHHAGPAQSADHFARSQGLVQQLGHRHHAAHQAGTLGLGPDGPHGTFWRAEIFEVRGGIVGESLFWAASTLLGTVGAHILALFGVLVAVTLLTGASAASVMRSGALVPTRSE